MRKLYKAKQTYSIAEAADRLSLTLGESVTADEVLQLMADGEIGIFWWLANRLARPVAPISILTDGRPDILGPSRKLVVNEPAGDVQGITGIFKICTEVDIQAKKWARTKCTGGDEHLPWEGTILSDSDGAFWELMGYNNTTTEGGDYCPRREYPLWDDIIVTKDELDRFESGLSEESSSAPSEVVPADISNRERESLHKQIAALALLLASKNARYRNGEGPSANAIADDITALLETMPDADKKGASHTSLRNSIKAGIELLLR